MSESTLFHVRGMVVLSAHSIPNLITLVRLTLVPVMGYFLLGGEHSLALIVFFAAAVTDLLDGIIARHFKSTSTLVFATVIASGTQYVWLWGHKAVRDGRQAR